MLLLLMPFFTPTPLRAALPAARPAQAVQDSVDLKRFGVAGDGITDDSAAIQKALNSGVKAVNGQHLKCRIASSIIVPQGVRFYDFNLVAGTPGMKMVLVNSSCILQGTLVGTGTVNSSTTNFFEQGVFPAADGVSDVTLDLDISNIMVGIHATPLKTEIPKRWNITAYVHDIVGTTGRSEGYGVLLSPASLCTGSIKARDIHRHALYLSAGASYNNMTVDVDRCGQACVNIYSKPTQPRTTHNTVRGIVRGMYNPSGQKGLAAGISLLGGVDDNDISVQVIGSSEADVAIKVNGDQAAGGVYPRGNRIHNCTLTGSFSGDVISIVNADSTTVEDNDITATCGAAIIGLRVAGSPDRPKHGAYVRRNKIDAMGRNVRGIIDTATNADTDIAPDNNIVNNGIGKKVDIQPRSFPARSPHS